MRIALFLFAASCAAQPYAASNGTPISRLSWLRHQKHLQSAPVGILGDSTLGGYWPLTEGSGSVAYDASSASLNGPWAGTAAGTSGYYSAGKIGPWSGSFNGTNNVVALTSGAVTSFSTSAFSLLAWAKITTLGVRQFILAIANADIEMDASNNFLLNQTGVGAICTATATPTDSAWHLWAATWDGTYCHVYVDGADVSGVKTNTPSFAANSWVLGARSNNSSWMAGLAGGVRLYNRVLDAATIAAVYAAENR